MAIIDLDTDSLYDHGTITKFLSDSLIGSPPKSEVMLIHIYCYDKVKMVTPLYLSIALLDSLLKILSTEPYKDCLSIKVGDEARQYYRKNYQTIWELLGELISRVCEKRPEETMHFIFSGIRPRDTDEGHRLALARFIIDMGHLLNTALPTQDKREIKCVFGGNLLFGCLLYHLQAEKEKKRGEPKEKKIFRQILMLKWDQSRGEGPYSWLHWSTKVE